MPFLPPTGALRRCSFATAALAGAAGLLVPALAGAQALPPLSPALDRFNLSVGAYYAEPTFQASVNTTAGGLSSGKLKGDHVTLPRVSGEALLFGNHGLSFDYYRYSRDYTNTFATVTELGPIPVTAMGGVNFDLKVEFAKLAYKYWFTWGDTALGLGAGVAYYRIGLDSNAYAGLNGATRTFSRHDSDDAFAPLLEVGLRHAITPDLRLFADLSGVRKGGSGLHGNIYSGMVGIEWFPLKNVGVALAYGANDIDLRRDGSGVDRLRIKTQGPTAFVKARF